MQTALDKSVGATSAPTKGEYQARPLIDVLRDQFGSFNRAQEIIKQVILPQLARSEKAIGTTDIASLRLVSLSDRTVVRRNEDTKWLNFLEMRGDMPSILDYQYRIKERDIVTDTAPVVNIDSLSLFPQIQSVYNQRYNTLTTVGNTLRVSFMASSIAEQQADVNVLEEQIDDEIVRIRRTFNRLLMNNTEIVSELPGNVPQMGGFLTRSTLNTINCGGSNLTNTYLQSAINTIESLVGLTKQLVLWVTPGQLPVVRDLMINRFPGQNSESFYNSLDRLTREQMTNYHLPVQVVYEGYPGGSIPVVHDQQMVANTCLMFIGEYPRMARFKMDGQIGPFVLARPEQTLYEVVAVFDIATMDDPGQWSRIQFTNTAS
jgi:hypothetical protein